VAFRQWAGLRGPAFSCLRARSGGILRGVRGNLFHLNPDLPMPQIASRILSAAIFSLCIFSFSQAANRFVSASASSAGDGSLAHPFSTIQAASDSTNPGDTVFIMNGTYTNSWWNGTVVNITRSGSASAWIVYTAYPTTIRNFSLTAGAGSTSPAQLH